MVPVPVDLTGTWISFHSVFHKVAKRTVENRYSLKSENVAMLLL